MPQAPGELGFIVPHDRTNAQRNAHDESLAKMPMFASAPIPDAGPAKIILTDLWIDPEVVEDVGAEFTGFHQLTGSCVSMSGGDALFTVTCIQRKFTDEPTKAFVPWCLYTYGKTRYDQGDRGQGEGAVDSIFGQALKKYGSFDIHQPGLPTFKTDDGWYLDRATEFHWSDGGTELVRKWDDTAKHRTLGTISPLYTSQDIKNSILSGRPVLYGCSRFIGGGKIVSGGGKPYVRGVYDGRGGHCLAADTKIPLIDGTEQTIGELADEGKPVWIYSYDHESGKVIPKEATARMTRDSVPEGMIRVGLDNNESVETTLDHQFMLRDGTYKEAQHLQAGDSLMPLYRKNSETKRHPGYEMVLDPGSMTWELTHRRVAECVPLQTLRFREGALIPDDLTIGCRPVVHHLNFNKRNNNPANLSLMVNREHWKYHAAVSEGVWDRMDPEYRSARKERMSVWVKGLWQDDKYREMMRLVSVANMKKLQAKIDADPELRKQHSAASGERMKKLWKDPVFRTEKTRQTKALMNTPEAKAAAAEKCRARTGNQAFIENCRKAASLREADPGFRAKRLAAIKERSTTQGHRDRMAELRRKRWADPKQKLRQAEATRLQWVRQRAVQPVNHKVVSVTLLPGNTGPTYCFQVEGTHNFAVASGVFVHNSTCFLGYWDHPNNGPLYLYSNQWPTSTYPKDPAGGGRCCVWTPESEVDKIFSQFGGGNGETMSLANQSADPAATAARLIDWASM